MFKKIKEFFSTSKGSIAAKFAGWSTKKTIAVSVSSAVVLVGVLAGGIVAYKNAHPVEETKKEVAVKSVVKNTKGQVEIPTYTSCAISGDSIEKDLTLYITKGTGSDEKITGTNFKIKLLKEDEASKIKNLDTDINMDRAYLAKAEELGTSDQEGNEKNLAAVKKAVKEQLGVNEEKKDESKKSDSKEEKELEISAETKKPVTVKEALVLEKQKHIAEFAKTLNGLSGDTYTDDDSDGMIHIDKIDSGKYSACMIPENEFDCDQYAVGVTVKDKIDYKALKDIKKKVSKNAGDTKPAAPPQEARLSDTVEYVNSSKTPFYKNVSVGEYKASASGSRTFELNPTQTSGRRGARGLRLFSLNHRFFKFRIGASTNFWTINPIKWATEVTDPSTLEEQKTVAGANIVTASNVKLFASSYGEANHIGFAVTANGCEVTSVSSSTSGVSATYSNGTITVSANAQTPAVKGGVITVHTTKGDATCDIIEVVGANSEVKSGDKTVYEDASGNKAMTVGDLNGSGYIQDGYKYTGWQVIDGHRYFYDKNGNYVTGQQVIQGVMYNFGSDGKLIPKGTGIDVSKWQGNIDWSQVRTTASYAIIRCGYRGSSGALGIDPYYAKNMSGAKANGILTGVYFYSKAQNEAQAVEEASLAVQLVREQGGVSLPIYIDIEDNPSQGHLSNAERTAIVHAFCNTVRASGYAPGVYTGMNWWMNKLNHDELTQYSVWLARYNTVLSDAKYPWNGRVDIWQYASDGSVPGIAGRVDMNRSYF